MSEFRTKAGLAQMLKGGVIMDVVNAEQARIAEQAGACAVMALERIPADMRNLGQVCRMSDPKMVKSIMDAVEIPVMAKCRIGHIVEAQVLQELGVDYIDESEVLTPADWAKHIPKDEYKVPFVCGAKDIGEALRRIGEGAAMLRTKGEAGTGDISEAIKHIRLVQKGLNDVLGAREDDLPELLNELRVPIEVLKDVRKQGKLPVVNFAAGGVATPSDAAMCMQLGCDGVFVGLGIFKSENPEKLAKAIVDAVTHYRDPKRLLECLTDLGQLMFGVSIDSLLPEKRLAGR